MSEMMEAIVGNLGGAFDDGAIQMKYKGGSGGNPWDHGVYTGVRKVYVTSNFSEILHIMVDYDKAGKVETRQNGDMMGEDRVQGQQNEVLV